MDKYNHISLALLILAISLVGFGAVGSFGFIGEQYKILSSMFLSIGSLIACLIPPLQLYFNDQRDQALKNKTAEIIKNHLDKQNNL